jgi:hypothetical protein
VSHAYGAGSHLLTHGTKISPSDLLSVDRIILQGGSNMTGTDLCVNKPHCAAAVRL